ncbi:MAG: hypothetical protein WC729_00915 [Sphingomonas sp.]|jgi:hypothetical protein|uniref:hypothetical protein n=1 Tax=Sphingomonas sp. TaxID=28214 RepID=UPI003568F967
MNISARTVFAFIAGCVPALLAAQEVVPAQGAPVSSAATTPADPGPAQGYVRLSANTPVDIEVAGALSSKTSKIDETFPIRLRSPIVVDGKTVVPVGTMGQGEVVHAAKARAMGKAGELILAARYLGCGDTRIGLRGFQLGAGATGEDNIDKAAILTIVVATPFMFLSGGDLIVPPGSPGRARLSKPVDIRMEPSPVCPASGPGAAMSTTPAPVPAAVTAPAPQETATAAPTPVSSK